MGGSGKSVLAGALKRDRAVHRQFPDGLVWVPLEPPAGDAAARRSMLAQRQQEQVAKLTPTGQDAGEVTDVEQGRDRLAELLRDKARLLVVDNVWTTDDVYAFSVLDCRGALVLTTRDMGLVRAVGAAEVEVAELSDGQAQTLAAGWAGVPAERLPAQAVDTLGLVGNLALGVATLAAQARGDGQRWVELAGRLRAADLAALKLESPDYPHPSLLAAVQLGLDYLDRSAQRRYRELAVFAGHGAVPRSAVEALWAPVGLSAADVGDLLAALGNRALLRRDPVTGRVDLHDLQFDVARAGLGDALAEAHGQLLAGYAACCSRGWPSGPDDGCFYQHLAEHLAAAGRRDELYRLLTDFGWLHAKLAATDITAVIADYELTTDPDLQLIQGALRLSAHGLFRDPDQLAGQLVGRLLAHRQPTIHTFIEHVRNWRGRPWLCPRTASLTPPGGPLQHILTGHTSGVAAVAVANDRIVSGSDDRTVRVWELATGRELVGWHGDASFYACAAALADTGGNRLTVVAGDGAGAVHILELVS